MAALAAAGRRFTGAAGRRFTAAALGTAGGGGTPPSFAGSHTSKGGSKGPPSKWPTPSKAANDPEDPDIATGAEHP